MDIKLYYISGISKEDTPYFATRDEQNAYFANRQVAVVENTWYPPYYKNEIYFDTSVLNTNTQANYLSLEYNNKVYYYFINAIRYRSEEVISINIEMDTIQTFMFDFSVTSAIIERRTIKRWFKFQGKYYINREYLRENLSEGTYINEKPTYVYNEPDIDSNVKVKGWVIINYTEMATSQKPAQVNGQVKYTNEDGTQLYYSTYEQVFIPITYPVSNTIKNASGNNSGHWVMPNALRNYSADAGLIEAHFVPFTPFYDITYDKNTDGYVTINVSDTKGRVLGWTETMASYGGVFPYSASNDESNPIAPKVYSFDISELTKEFEPVTTTATVWKYSKEPACLDENYIRVRFGEANDYATFPLYQLSQASIYGYYFADILNGYRYYKIQPDSAYVSSDQYKSLVKTKTPLYCDACTSGWQEWVASNRGTMLQASMNIPLSMAKTALGSVGEGQNTLAMKTGLSGITAGIKLAGTLMNHQNEPGNVHSTGSSYTDLLNKDGIVQYSRLIVADITQVAQYYRRYGNLVNEYIDTSKNLFTEYNLRYYFNYIKLAECDVHLSDYLETNDVTGSIKDRLVNGIRLWNVDKTDLCDYSYDNVEKDFVS